MIKVSSQLRNGDKGRFFICGLLSAALLCSMALCFTGIFNYSSACAICGARKQTSEWQVAGVQLPLLWHSVVTDTTLSRALAVNGIVGQHKHRWLFAAGGGNGITCALGNGRDVARMAESEAFANVVLRLHRKGEFRLRDTALRRAFAAERKELETLLYAAYLSETAPDGSEWKAELEAELDPNTE